MILILSLMYLSAIWVGMSNECLDQGVVVGGGVIHLVIT